jgi:hypothetical protein
MGLKDTLNQAHQALHKAGIDHALIGGLGLAMLGIHRATFDVDFLIDGENKADTINVMNEAGWKLVMETENVLHFDGKGRVDFLLANRPLSKQMLKEAEQTNFGIKNVKAEGMIGLKIQAYTNDQDRELQDKADIKSIIEKTADLDWNQVKTYADLFGEWAFIESLRKKK